MLSLFYKRYFVAISLFADLEKAKDAHVEHKFGSNGPWEVYGVSLRAGSVAHSLGWVVVCTNDSAPAYWNKLMHSKRHRFALWRHDGLVFAPYGFPTDPSGDPWKPLPPLDYESFQDVQVTTVYPVRELTEKRAAKTAWAQFMAGNRSHTEWYDASIDRRWTKLFHQ
jgi:hypothetical protein